MTAEVIDFKTISRKDLEDLRRLEIEEEMQRTKLKRYVDHFKQHWIIYALLAPALIFFFLRAYLPIMDILTAFRKNQAMEGISMWDAQWYGLFPLRRMMFGPMSNEFWRAFRNTFTLSMYGMLFGFPIPIFLALMFSEIKGGYRAVTQVLTYLPRFISTVVIVSLITLMFASGSEQHNVPSGVLHRLLQFFGAAYPHQNILGHPTFFRPIFIISGIWEGAGFGSIVYFAAIMAISPTSYEAAKIDGANKLAQIKHITMPGMAPTLTIMLILRIGSVLSVGFEQIILMVQGQDQMVFENAEVLSTFVLRVSGQFTALSPGLGLPPQIAIALATAVDLFNSIIAMLLVVGANFISRRVSNTSLF